MSEAGSDKAGSAPAIQEFLAALDRTQYLDARQQTAYQRRLLDRLLRHARAETDLYGDRVGVVFRDDDTIDWDRWEEIPILTRAGAQAHTEAVTARTLPPEVGNVRLAETSGSTGESWRFRTTQLQGLATACANERFYHWHGIARDALWGSITTSHPEAVWPQGIQLPGWRLGAPESACSHITIRTPHHRQLEWLLRVKPDVVMSWPSNLAELALIAGGELGGLGATAAVTLSEPLTGERRELIRDAFGADPIDFYGSMEAGFVAGMCPHSRKYHVTADLVLVEVVDDDGVAVEPGTEGRVIVTPFYGYATPLIRYDLGDRCIMAAEPCGCGRTLPTLERILGRERNVFRFGDGTSVWPQLLSEEIQPFVPHRRFQVVQTARDHIEYRYVPVAGGGEPDVAGLTAFVRARLHPSLKVTPVAVVEITTTAKREDYIRAF